MNVDFIFVGVFTYLVLEIDISHVMQLDLFSK